MLIYVYRQSKLPGRAAALDSGHHKNKFTMANVADLFWRMAEEPPFRVLAQKCAKYFSTSVRTHERWDTSRRPNYLTGVLRAADQAKADGIRKILAVEFGVAAGNGLLALQDIAETVEAETGVSIHVIGFDSGQGMPAVPFDYRDHTDWWIPQDYPMDVPGLTSRLKPRTRLILGPVVENIRKFVDENDVPVGFVAFDLDYYSSTKDAFLLLSSPKRKMLRRTTIYFDDIDFFFNHESGGELLAIRELNESSAEIKIDKWRGIRKQRPFFEAPWLDKMYVAHDLAAIQAFRPIRAPRQHAS